MTADQITDALQKAGARRADARQAAEDAMREIRELVRAADAEGIERKQIAALAGISRQAVYDVLDGHD